jgi:hypothetical protein
MRKLIILIVLNAFIVRNNLFIFATLKNLLDFNVFALLKNVKSVTKKLFSNEIMIIIKSNLK